MERGLTSQDRYHAPYQHAYWEIDRWPSDMIEEEVAECTGKDSGEVIEMANSRRNLHQNVTHIEDG